LEAQSQGLACVATALPGIAELIEDGRTGVLVPSSDAAALAAALEQLVRDPGMRRRLGAAGEARGRGEVDMHAGIDLLAERFGLTPLRAAAEGSLYAGCVLCAAEASGSPGTIGRPRDRAVVSR